MVAAALAMTAVAVLAQTPTAKPAQKALGAWDKYAHALLQTNEATFVN